MLALLSSPGPHGLPYAGEPEGIVAVQGPISTLAFVLPLAGPVPHTIQPPVPQSCQNSTPNVALQVLVVDQDGQPVDLSTATELELLLRAPDGVLQPVAAALVNNGLDGLLQYVTTAEDLTEAGWWALQAKMTFVQQVILTRWAAFQVEANIGDL